MGNDNFDRDDQSANQDGASQGGNPGAGQNQDRTNPFERQQNQQGGQQSGGQAGQGQGVRQEDDFDSEDRLDGGGQGSDVDR